MYNRLSPKQEAENAYKYGVKDATEGRERKNASDFYGPYADDYLEGYQSVLNKRKENIEDLSAFFDFGGKK
jgi:hypothetical protein